MNDPLLTMTSGKSVPTAPTDRERVNQTLVRVWLYIICALVVAMIVVGGATRLTESGLSITEWKPLLGVFPPLSDSDWLIEFKKYQQIPQYTHLNLGMSMTQFKFIYWWEWSHRFLGRFIGIVFVLPFVYFWMSSRLQPGMLAKLTGLLALGALQAVIGWWMVSSGLAVRTDVSQIRLAIHLILACLILAYGFWLAQGLLPGKLPASPLWLRLMACVITLAILLQIFLGALVAGLNAGLAFNDWPLMDGAIIPESLFVLEPKWLNFFDNPKLVQFTHRVNAYGLVLLIVANFAVVRLFSDDPGTNRMAAIVLYCALGQTALGIATLMLQAPLFLALLHQIVAIALLILAVINWRSLKGAAPEHNRQQDTNEQVWFKAAK